MTAGAPPPSCSRRSSAALYAHASRAPVPVTLDTDGTVDVESPPGAGTRLHVEIPC